MKKILLFSFLFFFLFGFSQQNEKPNKSVSKVKPDKATKALRKKHAKNLASSPFKEVTKLTKKERKAIPIFSLLMELEIELLLLQMGFKKLV